jgi:hypothetical protein
LVWFHPRKGVPSPEKTFNPPAINLQDELTFGIKRKADIAAVISSKHRVGRSKFRKIDPLERLSEDVNFHLQKALIAAVRTKIVRNGYGVKAPDFSLNTVFAEMQPNFHYGRILKFGNAESTARHPDPKTPPTGEEYFAS